MAEIFMRGIAYSSDHIRVKRALAKELHKPPFTTQASYPINFHVWLFKDKHKRGLSHGGTGALTLPTAELGEMFLHKFGPGSAGIWLDGRQILFARSRRPPRDDVVESIAHFPYQDPAVLEARQVREQEFASKRVTVTAVQFGWDCRDDVFSCEWEYEPPTGLSAYVAFSDDPRELRVHLEQDSSVIMIAIRFPTIVAVSAHTLLRRQHAVWLSLATAPHYEQQEKPPNRHGDDLPSLLAAWADVFGIPDKPVQRQRLPFLPFNDHERVVSFTSHAVRLVLRTENDLQTFWDLAETAELPKLGDYPVPMERRGLFSVTALDLLHAWQQRLSLGVSFQVEGIMRALLVDAREMLEIRPSMQDMINRRGIPYTVAFLKYLRLRLKNWWSDMDIDNSIFQMQMFFLRVQRAFEQQTTLPVLDARDTDVVQTMHVVIKPTSMALDGPFPELSNRVLRAYPQEYHECFLRVTFAEEGKLPYRWDRNVDGRKFVDRRVGTLLRRGLMIGSHHFDFLAYSMSALRERSVWLLKPFTYSMQGYTQKVDAPTIIAGLGNFPLDTLVCPARYAARISQAFTATNQIRVELDPSQVLRREDIWTRDGLYCFTDGVGTISLELARKIWAFMNSIQKRTRRSQGTPRAYQVRFQGAKGMLSVDYKLQGSVLTIPPSMTKFTAEGRFIEIAQVFTTPFPYSFNRPLIMLLEGLGVPYAVFEHYQDAAVQEVNDSSRTIAGAGRLFEKFGLGASFRVPSVLNSLAKLSGLSDAGARPFYDRILHCAKNHILRDLKNYARIPVPGAWTLVGVADMHGELGENEIYACVRKDGRTIYLEGDVMISRSPTSHPGDVQIARGIGKPKRGSSFDHERLPNMIVFSVRGKRPLASCLGGGDLDGDIYDCVPLNECPDLRPKRLYPPASYEPVQKKTLDRPSTMLDVADFVVDYINSDVVGLVATQWLIIADQSKEGIFDPDCLVLSQLHSDAVDFPKSGTPVQVDRIPRLKFREKPDWSAAETVDLESSTEYYESQRAIGRLFRRIELSDGKSKRENRRERERMRRTRAQRVEDMADSLAELTLASIGDEVMIAVERRVSEFLDVRAEPPRELREYIARLFQSYASELEGICATQVISHRRNSMLSEEEAISGTVMEKTAIKMKRKEVLGKLREHTDHLVRGMRAELDAKEDELLETALQRGWVAWTLSVKETKLFGGKSFGLIALGSIFETIKEIEAAQSSDSE